MEGNYIKIDRKILDWEWYKTEKTKCLFLHCLLNANWKDGRFEGVDIPRGSFVTSIPSLVEELGMSYQSVRTALNHLKSTGEITVTTHPKFSVITVNNYSQYQDVNAKCNSQVTGKQQASNRQATGKQQASNNNRRKKEGKKGSKEEGKNIYKEPTVYYPNDDKLNQAFTDYVEMRKQIKSPMTERAITLAQNKLKELAVIPFSDMMDNDLAIEILNQSVMNNWKGLFPLKDNDNNKQSRTQNMAQEVDSWIKQSSGNS